MNDKKNSILIILLKFSSICFASVLLLILLNVLTYKKIEENKIKKDKVAMDFLITDVKNYSGRKYFRTVSDRFKESIYYYEAYDNNSKIISYIVFTSCNGYGGEMRIMMAFDKNLKILNGKLLDNYETIGMGKKAESEMLMNNFKGTNTEEKPLPRNKNMIISNDSVTGATITFNGIVNGIDKAIALLKNEL